LAQLAQEAFQRRLGNWLGTQTLRIAQRRVSMLVEQLKAEAMTDKQVQVLVINLS